MRVSAWMARAALAAIILGSGTAAFAHTHNSYASTTTHGRVTSCDQIEFKFDDQPRVARDEQTFNIARSQAPTLKAHLSEGVGLTAFTGSSSDYVVHACKAASATYSAPSEENLAAIRAEFASGELRVHTPESENWGLYLIVEAPAGASFDLSTANGPLDLRELSGNVAAHTENGPLSLDRCSGEVNASTENGPLSVTGDSGRLRVRTQNGPLSVALAGSRWANGDLEGSTQNGPLSVTVGSGYSSGVRVEARGYSPVSCRGCSGAQRTWDDSGRMIQIGSEPVVVRLSTENGPVSVGPRGSRNDD